MADHHIDPLRDTQLLVGQPAAHARDAQGLVREGHAPAVRLDAVARPAQLLELAKRDAVAALEIEHGPALQAGALP